MDAMSGVGKITRCLLSAKIQVLRVIAFLLTRYIGSSKRVNAVKSLNCSLFIICMKTEFKCQGKYLVHDSTCSSINVLILPQNYIARLKLADIYQFKLNNIYIFYSWLFYISPKDVCNQYGNSCSIFLSRYEVELQFIFVCRKRFFHTF